MAESSDDIISLFIYVFFVHPVCSWILTPKRYPKKKAICFAVAFLALVASVKVGLEFNDRGANYFQLLGVKRSSTPMEIKKAYKVRGLELHPDKNPSPEAATQFAAMKDAYDVLMDQEFRDIYNKMGPEAIKNKRHMDESQILMEIAVYYIVWGLLSYVLTLGKSGSSARSWIYTGEIAMLVLEASVMLSGQGKSVIPDWFLPSLTDHELVWVMHSIFPAYMNGCRSICAFLYVDLEKEARDLMLAIQQGHNDLLLKISLLSTEVRDLANSGGGKRRGSSPSRKGSAAEIDNCSPRGQLLKLEERMKANASNVNTVVSQIPDSSKQSGKSNFWWILGAYVIFYYVFQ